MSIIKDSCLVCLVTKQNDFDVIFETLQTDETNSYKTIKRYKSELGLIYEDIFNLQISDNMIFPEYMCPCCALQLKLLSKFKKKALNSYRTIEELHTEKNHEKFYLRAKNNYHEIEPSILTNFEQEDQENKEIISNDYIVDENDDDNDNIIVSSEAVSSDDNGQFNIVFEEIEYNQFTPASPVKNSEDECLEIQFLDTDNSKEEIIHINNQTDIEKESEDKDETNDNITILSNLSTYEDDEEVDITYENDARKRKKKPLTQCSKNEKYPCSSCNLDFYHKSHLVYHRKEKHPSYPCEVCGKKLLSLEGHSSHMKQHLGLPGFKCNDCGKTFNQKQHLIYHTQNHHSNERNFKCELCNKKFLTISDIKIHMRVHNDERRYACDICDKRFRAHTHMTNHRYMHFEKSIECPHCHLKYASPSTLRTHIRSVHDGICPYECEICQKKFKRKHHLLAHCQMHIKNNESLAKEYFDEHALVDESKEEIDELVWEET